jgi:hypothetical protein
MNINTDPISEAIDDIAADIDHGWQVLAEARLTSTSSLARSTSSLALVSAEKAVNALRAVTDAIGELEPGPALVIAGALRAGLGVTW